NCYTVLNADDEYYEECKKFTKANIYDISTSKNVKRGSFIKDNSIYFSDSDCDKIIDLKDVKLIGYHNYQNVLFCVTLAKLIGINDDSIRETLMSFSGVEHRLEFVRDLSGVKYYNDSKGTNVDASVKAIESFDKNVIILAGGYDKKVSLDNFFIAGKDKFKALILMGQTRDLFEQKAKEYGFKHIYLVDDMKQAVTQANKIAESGDVVLLSPASASWGMYNNYEERGNEFKDLVNNLRG
ncbi:MAG: cyanophycin synthetase, partial [Finegoldia magna]|nr:cyanophycin synthetase [Finegoldia magna]